MYVTYNERENVRLLDFDASILLKFFFFVHAYSYASKMFYVKILLKKNVIKNVKYSSMLSNFLMCL